MPKNFEAVTYLQVIDAINRFTMHADHQEWEDLRQFILDSVWVDYSDLDGQPPGRVDTRILISSWKDQANGLDATQHLLSNHCVEVFNKQKASCRVHAQVCRTLANNKGAGYWLLGGTYLFGLVRVGGFWKIERIAWKTLWSTGNASIFELAFEKLQDSQSSQPLPPETQELDPFVHNLLHDPRVR